MRRRRPGESEEAWNAGLRAYYPWVVGSAVSLLIFAILMWFAPDEYVYPILVAAMAAALAQAWPLGMWALNRAVNDASRAQTE